MFEITVRIQFSAAHNLREYKGACERLHGHNYKCEIAFVSPSAAKGGMVMDFKDAKAIANSVISGMDHAYLNDLPAFRKLNPTAENIARFLFMGISKKVKRPVKVSYVKVWETDGCAAKFYGKS